MSESTNHETRERCPDCNGMGEIWELMTFGPEVDETVRDCTTCNGTVLAAPSQTEGGGPDDTKQVSKEQGASPSVPPAVTTSQGPVVSDHKTNPGANSAPKKAPDSAPVPVVREGREEGMVTDGGEWIESVARHIGNLGRGWDRYDEREQDECRSMAAAAFMWKPDAPSVVSGGDRCPDCGSTDVTKGGGEFLWLSTRKDRTMGELKDVEAAKLYYEARDELAAAQQRFDLLETWRALDSLLKGAWGDMETKMGGAVVGVRKAHALLGELIEEGRDDG